MANNVLKIALDAFFLVKNDNNLYNSLYVIVKMKLETCKWLNITLTVSVISIGSFNVTKVKLVFLETLNWLKASNSIVSVDRNPLRKFQFEVNNSFMHNLEKMAKYTFKILRYEHQKIFKVCFVIFQHDS